MTRGAGGGSVTDKPLSVSAAAPTTVRRRRLFALRVAPAAGLARRLTLLLLSLLRAAVRPGRVLLAPVSRRIARDAMAALVLVARVHRFIIERHVASHP